MDTKAFLESYREIESLIEDNWNDIRKVDDNLRYYSFDEFTLGCSDDDVVITASNCYRNETDYEYTRLPLEWFESEEKFKSEIAKRIKEVEEEKAREAREAEERKDIETRRKVEEMEKYLEEYYKTHPRKPAGGNFH